MVLLNIPFPPLPILVSRGDTASEHAANSHDLLATAIMCQLTDPSIDMSQSCELMKRKQEVLNNLQEQLRRAWIPGSRKSLEVCYLIICNKFRDYMACYPGCNDLRTFGIDYVDRNSNIHLTALMHLKHQQQLPCVYATGADPADSYQNVLQAYVSAICYDDDHPQSQVLLPKIES